MEIPRLTGPSVAPGQVAPQYNNLGTVNTQLIQGGLQQLQTGATGFAQGLINSDIMREKAVQQQVQAWKEADETWAKKAVSNALNEISDLAGSDPNKEGFLSLQGDDAVKRLPGYEDAIQNIKTKYRENLFTPFQNTLYDLQLDEHIRQVKGVMGQWANKQADVAKVSAFVGYSDALQNSLRTNWQYDDRAALVYKDAIRNANEWLDFIGVHEPAARNQKIVEEQQKMVLARLQGMLGAHAYSEAESLVEGMAPSFGDKILPIQKMVEDSKTNYMHDVGNQAGWRLLLTLQRTRKLDRESQDYKLLESFPYGNKIAADLEKYREGLLDQDRRRLEGIGPGEKVESAYRDVMTSLAGGKVEEYLGGRRIVDLPSQEFEAKVVTRVPNKQLQKEIKKAYLNKLEAGQNYKLPMEDIIHVLQTEGLAPSKNTGTVRTDTPSSWGLQHQQNLQKSIDYIKDYVKAFQNDKAKNPNGLSPSSEQIREKVRSLSVDMKLQGGIKIPFTNITVPWFNKTKHWTEMTPEEQAAAKIEATPEVILEFKTRFETDPQLKDLPTTGPKGEHNLQQYLRRKLGLPYSQFVR